MTESIFAPFVLTTQESVDEALKVLLDKPAPRIKSSSHAELLEPDEIHEFTKKLREKRLKKLNESN